MRKIFFILSLLCVFAGKASASHIFGGELYYRHLTGASYEINLALYGDCSGLAFSSLFNLNAKINVKHDNNNLNDLFLVLDTSSIEEITPVCPLYKDSTQCKSLTHTTIGVTKFVYRDTVVLTAVGNYKFIFDGALNSAGRTANITNIVNASASQIYIEAELNNTVPNSSPQFTTIPTPFYCVNITQEYNQGAVDADNDSLVFTLADALSGGGVNVIYKPSYSAAFPIETFGAFEFNEVNGQMIFTPTILQNSVVVNKVYEYRNGQLIGSSMREMTFIVIDNCNNLPVAGNIDTPSISGGILSTGNVINTCVNAGQISFNYSFTDPDGDTIDLTAIAVTPDANLVINNNHSLQPSISFSRNVSTLPPGNYTFYIVAKDRHCPLSTSQTRGFTIRIVMPNEVHHTVLTPTDCAHKAEVKFDILNGLSPRTFILKQGANVLRTFTDTAVSFIDSFYAGNYTLTVASQYLSCSTDYHFTVADSGVFPFMPVFDNVPVCLDETPVPLTAFAYPNAVLHWYDTAGNLLPTAPVPITSSFITQRWLLSQQYLVCESNKDTVEVVVQPKPTVIITNDTGSVCIGEKIFLKAHGAETYQWLPAEKLFYEPDSSTFIRVFEPSLFTVIGANKTGCKDTVNFSYNNILPCCNFSYPNAFTPNNDGKNESWHPIMYGNHIYYELSIYNRWGRRLFHSFIPNEGWDGSFDGEPQDVGTYFYLLRAKCLTGRDETEKGEFMLVR